ncbi:MAG TPA: hydrogenase formation protein HypD [Syntrophomonadaceae bacterium]|nr:hydrogenase formation protein HypD [Syntrophomonadaceae bacterium]
MSNLNKEFRDPAKVEALLGKIQEFGSKPITLMEVCGTHTMSIFRYGIKSILPPNIRLLSGPGCPVCVTPRSAIDEAIEAAKRPNTVLAAFGDMVRVPGSQTSLAEARADGIDLRVVYSPLDAVDLAAENPDREIVFLAIGFETTAPTIAASVLIARKRDLKNFSIIGNNKTMPGALRALLTSPDLKVDGLICPGHVSTIIGSKPYEFIASELGIPAVITGFEPVDILQGILMLLTQINAETAQVEIQYSRGVIPEGNSQALKIINQVFKPSDDNWRGFGVIPDSGLILREEYRSFDARSKFDIKVSAADDDDGCRCGDVLRGVITPLECPMFGKACTPEKPVGACMVSSEGTCAAYYKYGE